MSDTIKTLDQVLGQLPDNTSRDISPQDARELALSTWGALMSRDPTMNDDSANTAGAGFFDEGSRWTNRLNKTYWVCFGGIPFAAIWWQVVFLQAFPGATVVAGTTPITVSFDGINTYTVSLDSPLAIGYIPSLPPSILQAGTLPAGVLLPAGQLSAGTLPAGVLLPVTQLSAGILPAGIDVPVSRLSGSPLSLVQATKSLVLNSAAQIIWTPDITEDSLTSYVVVNAVSHRPAFIINSSGIAHDARYAIGEAGGIYFGESGTTGGGDTVKGGIITSLGSGGGISQLTGDVTAGPGSGSQPATIGNDKVTLAKLAAAIKPSGTAAAGDEAVRALGTTASRACAGKDARLSDSRVPSGAAGGDLGGNYPNPTLGIGTTKGDILVRDTSVWARLAAGTAGFSLRSTGAAALPAYSQDAWTKLGSVTASGSATVDFTGLPTSAVYAAYMVVFDHIIPATGGASLKCRVSFSGVFQSALYSNQILAWSGTTIAVGSTVATDNGLGLSGDTQASANGFGVTGQILFPGIGSAAKYPTSNAITYQPTAGGVRYSNITNGQLESNGVFDGLRFLFSSGNIASGTFTLLGLAA